MSAQVRQSGRAAEIVGRPTLTQLRHRPPEFAVMHNAPFRLSVW